MKNIFILLLFLSNIVLAQNKFKMDLDYAEFPITNSLSELELYYNIYHSGMNQIETDEGEFLVGNLIIKITKKDSLNPIINNDYQIKIDLTEKQIQNYIVGVLKYHLEIGKYNVSIIGTSKEEIIPFKNKFEVEITGLTPGELTISDIQLASKINKSTSQEKSIFYKNTYDVICNPNSAFGNTLPVIYYYYEVYNVDKNVVSEKLKIEHILLNLEGKELYKKKKFIKRNNHSIVDVDKFIINRYPTGLYQLNINVSDSLGNYEVSKNKKIAIYNPDVIDTNTINYELNSNLESELNTLGEEELDDMFAKCEIIATNSEVSNWNKLTTYEGKIEYLINFWKERANSSSKDFHINKLEFDQRVETVNNRYGNSISGEGWESDFGKTYIKHGPPSEVDRYPSPADGEPFEVWKYFEIQGGVIFVFADINGFDDYRLVHSTLSGEMYDPDWHAKVLRLLNLR